MRYQGRITDWKDDRGFGFITPNGGGAVTFVHISAFGKGQQRPTGNELVTYEFERREEGASCPKCALRRNSPRFPTRKTAWNPKTIYIRASCGENWDLRLAAFHVESDRTLPAYRACIPTRKHRELPMSGKAVLFGDGLLRGGGILSKKLPWSRNRWRW